MEQSRLNRQYVIPDYTGAEIKALLRDPLHSSIMVTKNCLTLVSHPNTLFLYHIALVDNGFQRQHLLFNANSGA